MRFAVAVLVFGMFLTVGAASALATGSKSFYGDVSSVNSAAKTLVVANKATPSREMSFQLAPDAKIMMGGKALDLTRLKSGEHVKVSYRDEGTLHEAQRIEVTPPKTASVRPTHKPVSP